MPSIARLAAPLNEVELCEAVEPLMSMGSSVKISTCNILPGVENMIIDLVLYGSGFDTKFFRLIPLQPQEILQCRFLIREEDTGPPASKIDDLPFELDA